MAAAPSVALVSVLCADRVGLVSGIADHLFDAGVNLRDTNFAALGSGAEFSALCELPEGLSVETIETALKALDVLAGAQIRVVPYSFDPNPLETGRVTHRIAVSGGDQLGLVARLADVFAQYGANIVRLEAASSQLPRAGSTSRALRCSSRPPAPTSASRPSPTRPERWASSARSRRAGRNHLSPQAGRGRLAEGERVRGRGRARTQASELPRPLTPTLSPQAGRGRTL